MYFTILHRHPNFTNLNHSMLTVVHPEHVAVTQTHQLSVDFTSLDHEILCIQTRHSYSSNITKNKVLTPILVPLKSRILSLVVRV